MDIPKTSRIPPVDFIRKSVEEIRKKIMLKPYPLIIEGIVCWFPRYLSG